MKKSNSAERLKELMQIMGIKQADIIEKTGIPKSAMSMYISGQRVPRQNRISEIADVYNINEAWLMGYDVPMERSSTIIESNKQFNSKDERDIKNDLETLREKLINKEFGPAAYDGEDIPEDDIDLFLGQVDLMLRRVKSINKEKYNPHKNKK